jgi:hypothetical protein
MVISLQDYYPHRHRLGDRQAFGHVSFDNWAAAGRPRQRDRRDMQQRCRSGGLVQPGNAAILEHSPIDHVIEGALRRVVLDQRQGFSSLKVKINTVVNVGGVKA